MNHIGVQGPEGKFWEVTLCGRSSVNDDLVQIFDIDDEYCFQKVDCKSCIKIMKKYNREK